MHLKNEKENNPSTNLTSLSSTTSSSTSSTDSGVVIIDSTATFNRQHRAGGREAANESEGDKQGTTKDKLQTTTTTTTKDNLQQEPQLNDNSAISTSINIENTLNISNNATRPPHPLPPQAEAERGTNASKNYSPTVSIRSTTISIISIDENAIDSSVIDTDSDIEADAEGEHSNYTVKKLGQQITYPPNSNDIPNINTGLKMISQQIRPNIHPQANGGSPTLADHILNGSLCTPTSGALAVSQQANTPQIGSIALTNSTDVTFGDKHFYEGPVTIQQFLIDSRDKGKQPNDDSGQDNPTFSGEALTQNGGKMFPTSNEGRLRLPHTLSRRAIWITSIFVVLTIIIGTIIATQTDIFSSAVKPQNLTLTQIQVKDWGGLPPKNKLTELKLPVHRVVISHTASETCASQAVCSYRVRVIQTFHMNSFGFDDCGYNFLVGGDGLVYVARGWDIQGAHTKGYNTDSISISLIGTFTNMKPTEDQLKATQLLIEEGVRLQKVVPNYRLYGARQLAATESPGEMLYQILKTWPHWSQQI